MILGIGENFTSGKETIKDAAGSVKTVNNETILQPISGNVQDITTAKDPSFFFWSAR